MRQPRRPVSTLRIYTFMTSLNPQSQSTNTASNQLHRITSTDRQLTQGGIQAMSRQTSDASRRLIRPVFRNNRPPHQTPRRVESGWGSHPSQASPIRGLHRSALRDPWPRGRCMFDPLHPVATRGISTRQKSPPPHPVPPSFILCSAKLPHACPALSRRAII